MIRVLFVYSDKFCSCTRKRIFEVAKFLIKYKHEEILTHVKYFPNLSSKDIEKHDIIIFQRLGANAIILNREKKNWIVQQIRKYKKQKIFIYDIDDLIFDRQKSFPKIMMRLCNYTLAPNKYLENKQREYSDNTHVIPTHIDLDLFEKIPPVKGFPESINIGWVTSAGLGLNIFDSIYDELYEKYHKKVKFHFFSAAQPCSVIRSKYDTSFVTPYELVSIKQLYAICKSLDFAIMPIDLNEIAFCRVGKLSNREKANFLKSKSEIKYINFGASGAPIIATPIPSYREAITHGLNGFLATSKEDWIKYIELLINSPEARNKVGFAAKEDVYNNYSPQVTAERYHKFFKAILRR